MRIVLLELDGRVVALAGALEPEVEESAAGSTGGRGLVLRWYRRLQDAVRRSETARNLRLHALWDWLHRRLAADEPLLFRLRTAQAVEIAHPASQSPDEARAAWQHYLARRGRVQLASLALCLLISPVTVLLAPLPGPNLIGYWFLYRGVCHFLMMQGIRRARRHGVAVSFEPLAQLDRLPSEEASHYLQRVTQVISETMRGADLGSTIG